MYFAVLLVHIVLSLMLIGLVLLQQGKGADMGAAFGGGSNTLFGATGATSFILKLTTGTAVAFMVTSVLLIKLAASQPGLSSSSVTSDPLQGSVLEKLTKEAEAAKAESQKVDVEANKLNATGSEAKVVTGEVAKGATAEGASAKTEVVEPIKADDVKTVTKAEGNAPAQAKVDDKAK